jgi:tetratricopeptide (TPR) repeat protein
MLNGLEDLVLSFIERGELPEGATRSLDLVKRLETYQEELDWIVTKLSAFEKPDLKLIRCARLLADAFDKIGKYNSARESLRIWSMVESEFLEANPLRTEPKRFIEICWLAWAKSVSHHRHHGKGEIAQAVSLTEKLLSFAKSFAKSSLKMPEVLLAMVNYAHARHMQVMGKGRQADEHFTAALDCCNNIVNNPENSEDEIKSAKHLSAIFLIQIARFLLEGGHLERSWRLIQVSDTILSDNRDDLNKSFIVLLKGCILRQKQSLDESIKLLKIVVEQFKKQSNGRYLFRSMHELAKALYNRASTSEDTNSKSKDYSLAMSILADLSTHISRHEDSSVDRRNTNRWDVNRFLLESRIHLAQDNIKSARESASKANSILASHLKEDSHDLRMLATAITGEILLKESKPIEVIKLCAPMLNRPKLDDHIDKTDETWVRVVAWEACISLLHTEKAIELKSEVGNITLIENAYIKSRAEEVFQKHEALLRKGFVIPHDTENTNHEFWKEELRRYLVNLVAIRHPSETIESHAERLGIKRQTLANWKSEFSQSQKK